MRGIELNWEIKTEESTMAKKQQKKCSKSLVIREMQIKQPWDSTLHQLEWLRSKPQVAAHVVKDVEKEEQSSIAGGIANSYNHSENPQKIGNSST